jgi:hypothetical protein
MKTYIGRHGRHALNFIGLNILEKLFQVELPHNDDLPVAARKEPFIMATPKE